MTRLLSSAAISATVALCAAQAATAEKPPPPPPGPEETHCTFKDNINATDGASGGYVLFAPDSGHTTFLFDATTGLVVHNWTHTYQPGQKVSLLENGLLLHTGFDEKSKEGPSVCQKPPAGGYQMKVDWDSKVVATHHDSDETGCQHHDTIVLPNGNFMYPRYQTKSADEARQAGSKSYQGIAPDSIVEVNATTGAVAWEWHVWDHLIQDFNSSADNFGVVADHPELLDLNIGGTPPYHPPTGGDDDGVPDFSDWNHVNAVDYNEALNQIVISFHNQGEAIVVDHSTTTEEAAGHTGGRSGMGGDFLYRWGTPQNYGAPGDNTLKGQHNVHWISNDAGAKAEATSMLVFDNFYGDKDEKLSAARQFETPVPDSKTGRYELTKGEAYAPADASWTYSGDGLFSQAISSAQRLPNGNTLVDEGNSCTFREVTSENALVWKFVAPDDLSRTGCFRTYHYAADYPGLAGHDLSKGVCA